MSYSRFLTITVVLVLAFSIISAREPSYLFSFFKGNGEDGMYLAYSNDGITFISLNNDQPLIHPQIGKDRLMRDPSIVRGPDGLFHMVWTSGWNDRCIGYAKSPDLINWSDQDSIFVMKNEPTARNCWAPEIFYDDISSRYIIVWSTTIPGRFPETSATCDNGNNHRLYYVTSKDCKTFSETKLFYDPKFNCIDGFIIRNENQYMLVFKDETCSPAAKNFRIASSDSPTGPYGKLSDVLPTGSNWVEGPSIVKRDNEWLLYYDIYTKGSYGIRKSKNMADWEYVSDNMTKPAGARHGTVFPISNLILDNSPAGFHFKTTANKNTFCEHLKNIPSINRINNSIIINTDPNIFNYLRIYSLQGKSIINRKINNKRIVITRENLFKNGKYNSIYLFACSGKNRKYHSTVIW